MFIYIDSLLKMRDGIVSPVGHATGEVLTSDTPYVRNIPPYFIEPKSVALATSTNVVRFFSNADTKTLLSKIYDFVRELSARENVRFVGWYLDQVVFPCLSVNAFLHDSLFCRNTFRRLDEKWSRTDSLSLERAFMQGWYPEVRERYEDYTSAANHLTLERALAMTGLSGNVSAGSVGSDETDSGILASRLSGISLLHTRYETLLQKSVSWS